MTAPSHVEVLGEAVQLQSKYYGDATGLHLAMSGWAERARAAIALMRAPVGDAERFAFLASKARQDRSYDVFGNGGHWGIGLHSPDGNLSFRDAVDAAMHATGGGE